MGYVWKAVVLLTIAATAYFWATAEVPGGEKRYEQMVRLFKDRHGAGI